MALSLIALWIPLVRCLQQPNFIFVMTDDQDVMLDSMQAMPKTMELVAEQGISMHNAFSATPVCCPSRTETVSGRTFHNIEASSGQVPCQHAAADYNMFDNANALFQKFHSEGYITAAFGKVVNKVTDYWCSKGRVDGFDRIHLSCNYEDFYGTEYYNRYVDGTEETTTHDLDENVYQTAMMGNASVEFVAEQLQQQRDDADTAKPFFLWLGPYAPHTAAVPAAWYADALDDEQLYETPNYNQQCPSHHPPVSRNALLTSDVESELLQLNKDRLRSLMSVDDMVDALVQVLEEYGDVGENTYVVFTSDHGYNLGQFCIPCGKMQPYDNDVRIPLFMRGPGISAESTSNALVGNIDFLPTFLDLAGIAYDVDDYDGRSMKDILMSGNEFSGPWRDTYLLEFKSVGTFGMTHCPIWWKSDDGSVVPGQVIKPSSSLINNLIDSVELNNWRVLRILDAERNEYYAEFYDDSAANTGSPYFYEFFDLSTDEWQLDNRYDSLTDAQKTDYSALLQSYGECVGAQACSPFEGEEVSLGDISSTSTSTSIPSVGNKGGKNKGSKSAAAVAEKETTVLDDTAGSNAAVYIVMVENAKDLQRADDSDMEQEIYCQVIGYTKDNDIHVVRTQSVSGNRELEWTDEMFAFDDEDGYGAYNKFRFRVYGMMAESDGIVTTIKDELLAETTDLFRASDIKQCDMDYSKEMTLHHKQSGELVGTLFVTIAKNC